MSECRAFLASHLLGSAIAMQRAHRQTCSTDLKTNRAGDFDRDERVGPGIAQSV
jgi:hypothetical protein